jgi:hypothetical protein
LIFNYQALPNGIKEEIILNQARPQTENSNVFTFVSNFQVLSPKLSKMALLNPFFMTVKAIIFFTSRNHLRLTRLAIELMTLLSKLNDKKVVTTRHIIALERDAKWLNSLTEFTHCDRSYRFTHYGYRRHSNLRGRRYYSHFYYQWHSRRKWTHYSQSASGWRRRKWCPGANDCLGGGGGGGGGLIYNTSFAVAAVLTV